MRVKFHKNFNKSFKKLPIKVKVQFKKRLKLFLNEPLNLLLNNHALHGDWVDFRSINITGDFRAIYKYLNNDTVEFVIINTHSNLY